MSPWSRSGKLLALIEKMMHVIIIYYHVTSLSGRCCATSADLPVRELLIAAKFDVTY